MKLFEVRLDSSRLSDSQKAVLAIIALSPSPVVAASTIEQRDNLVMARNLLMKIGAVEAIDGQSAQLTPKGEQLAQDQNIIDDAGEVTDDAQDLVAKFA